MTFDDFLNIPPFSMDKAEKERALTGRLTELTKLHQANCPEYARMLEAVGFNPDSIRSYRDLPFLPVRLFKDMELRLCACSRTWSSGPFRRKTW